MKFAKVTKLIIATAVALGILASTSGIAAALGIGDYVLGRTIQGQYGCWLIVGEDPDAELWIVIPAPMEKCTSSGPSLSSVRGTAFLDANENGTREVNEMVFGEAWFKVTDGGAWFVCGYVGGDATYGVTVNPGTYYVLPVAPKGFKTTTPRVTAEVKADTPALNVDIGFVADPDAPGEACDQYNPPRP